MTIKKSTMPSCPDCYSRNIREILSSDQPEWLRKYKCDDCDCTWEEYISTKEWKLVIAEARDFKASWYGHENPGGGYDL